MKASSLVASVIFLSLAHVPAGSSTQDLDFPYRLGSDAAMQAGCMGPCECPILVQSPLQGSFALEPDVFDGVFRHYRVTNIDWQFKSGQAVVHVTGSGTYRVAGDQQELVVDLAVGGLPVERYDSGLTGGGSSFPALRVPVALHGFFCRDSVYGVDATPTVAGVTSPSTDLALRLGPNPFHGSTEVAFTLRTRQPVDLRILDLAGRVVRTLATRSPMESGLHVVRWDGRRDDGALAPAGVYFVRLKTLDREPGGTLIKL